MQQLAEKRKVSGIGEITMLEAELGKLVADLEARQVELAKAQAFDAAEQEFLTILKRIKTDGERLKAELENMLPRLESVAKDHTRAQVLALQHESLAYPMAVRTLGGFSDLVVTFLAVKLNWLKRIR